MAPTEIITYLLAVAAGGLSQWAAICGLRDRSLYVQEQSAVAAQSRGQDATTVVVGVPVLAVLLLAAALGHDLALLLVAGVLGYLTYLYASYSFGLTLNRLFFVYVSILACAGFGLVFGVHAALAGDLELPTDPGLPLLVAAGLLLVDVVFYASSWVRELGPATRGAPSRILEESGGRPAVQVIDLAVLLPAIGATAVAAVVGGGVAIAGVVVSLTLILLLGVAIMGMAIQEAREGKPDPSGLAVAALIALSHLGALAWLLSAF